MGILSLQAKLIEKGYNVDALEDGVVEAFRLAVGGLAKAAQNEWIRLAQTKLKTSRDIYINGLRQAESFSVRPVGVDTVYEIQLVGKMPNNFEFGMPSFDMKAVRPGWLGGSKALTAKDGHKFIRIPFRHSTSDSPRMGYTGKAKAIADPTLKTQLRKAVKQYGLDRMVRMASGAVAEGPVSRIPKAAPVHPYLKGLTRVQKAVSGSTEAGPRGQSQLITWRIMSEKSHPESWIHPGLRAANLLQDVETWMDNQLNKIIEQTLGDR